MQVPEPHHDDPIRRLGELFNELLPQRGLGQKHQKVGFRAERVPILHLV